MSTALPDSHAPVRHETPVRKFWFDDDSAAERDASGAVIAV